jgi:hypothetical protein
MRSTQNTDRNPSIVLAALLAFTPDEWDLEDNSDIA